MISPARLVRTYRALPARPGAGDEDEHRSWVSATAQSHVGYRTALDELVGESARSATAVICVTQRPGLLGAAIANYERQRHRDRELIIVTNSAAFDEAETRARVEAVPGARVVRTEPERSLGSCLNLAVDMTSAELVAKFDDDDHYGANYLADAVLAQRVLGAAVVGKHSYFAHLLTSDRTVLRFPGHELIESRFLAGGTLLFSRAVVGDVRFPDVSLREDGGFLAACWRRGLAVYAADHFNYVQRRGTHNAWEISDEAFARDALDLGPGERLDLVDV